MTTQQVIAMTGVYSVVLAVVVYFTRPTARRLAGAVAGGAAVGVMALGAIRLGESLDLWRVPFASTPGFLPLLYLALAVSCVPIYLVTWRVARRFGRRGLAVFLAAVAVVGPIRDYRVAATYPEWMVIAPGVAPVFGIAVTYVGVVGLGHAVMRLVVGPARGSRLARWPWEAEPSAAADPARDIGSGSS